MCSLLTGQTTVVLGATDRLPIYCGIFLHFVIVILKCSTPSYQIHVDKFALNVSRSSICLKIISGFRKNDNFCTSLALNEDGSINCTLSFLNHAIPVFQQ